MLEFTVDMDTGILSGGMGARSRKIIRHRGASVVERAIAMFDGSAAEFQRRLELVSGEQLDRSQIHYWRARGQFPPEWIEYVYHLTKIPYNELLSRQSKRHSAKRGSRK